MLALYLSHVDNRAIVKVLSYCFVVVASADLLRLNSPQFEKVYEAVLGFLMRDGEQVRASSAHTTDRARNA